MLESLGMEFTMAFADQLSKHRHARGLTQQQLAELAGIHVVQIRRYETERSQPTLEALKKIAIALGVTIDSLAFADGERGPDEDLRLEFEAVSRFGPEEKKLVKAVLKGLILKHEAERWTSTRET